MGLLSGTRSFFSISKRFSDLQFYEVVNRSAGCWALGKVGWKISKLGFLGVCCVSVCEYVLTPVKVRYVLQKLVVCALWCL